METIDDATIAELIEQGLSQRVIAEQLHISRSTLRRHLDKRKGTPRETVGTPHLHPRAILGCISLLPCDTTI